MVQVRTSFIPRDFHTVLLPAKWIEGFHMYCWMHLYVSRIKEHSCKTNNHVDGSATMTRVRNEGKLRLDSASCPRSQSSATAIVACSTSNAYLYSMQR